MTIEIRVTKPEEYRAACDAMAIALMSAPPDDEAWERSRPSWDEMPSLSAWDGDRCVAHAGQFVLETTVPGGARVLTGAVTRVGVLSTHRRRGIATRLMEGLVRDAQERSVPLMSLRASEAVIYRRYGFGMAGEFAEFTVDPRRASPVAGADTTGSMRILDPDELLDIVPPIYERAMHRRVGLVSRPPYFWRRLLLDATERKKASFVAVHLDEQGVADGYVHYDSKWVETTFAESGGEGNVHDLFGVTDAVELALWQYVFELDLVGSWSADQRPVDDLVRTAAHDRRAFHVHSIGDEQWVRLVDVDAALAARSYGPVAGSVTIGVRDPLVDGNNGTWRIDAAGPTRTDDAPDIECDIATLSAAYLGGPSWRQLAVTSETKVHTDGAVDTADALFQGALAPYSGTFF